MCFTGEVVNILPCDFGLYSDVLVLCFIYVVSVLLVSFLFVHKCECITGFAVFADVHVFVREMS